MLFSRDLPASLAVNVLHAVLHQWPRVDCATEHRLQRPRKSLALSGDITVPETARLEEGRRALPSDARLV